MRRPGAGGIRISLPTGQLELRMRLSELAAQLPEWFVYCHRTILVNLDYVSSISQGTLELRGGGTLPSAASVWQKSSKSCWISSGADGKCQNHPIKVIPCFRAEQAAVPCYDLLNNFSAQPMRLHGLFLCSPLHPFPDSGVFTGKDKKAVLRCRSSLMYGFATPGACAPATALSRRFIRREHSSVSDRPSRSGACVS